MGGISQTEHEKSRQSDHNVWLRGRSLYRWPCRRTWLWDCDVPVSSARCLVGSEALCELEACDTFAERVMAATTYFEASTIRETRPLDTLRFSLLVRITHWLNTISFV